MDLESDRLLNGLFEAINSHNTDNVAIWLSPGYEGHDVAEPGPIVGPDAACSTFEKYFRAFPDLNIAPKQVVAGKDCVAVYWTAEATHGGSWMRIPATGRRVSFDGVWIIQLKQGQIERWRCMWDLAGLLRKLGLLPEL